jgi:hypothetical protein
MPAQRKNARAPWRDVLLVHPAAELFPMMSDAEQVELGEDIKKNGLSHPIAIIEKAVPRADGSYHVSDPRQIIVVDGRNRLDAMEAVGLDVIGKDGQLVDHIERIEIDTDEVDPVTYVISANIRRRHLTAEQKRDLLVKLIKATPEKSDRQIARAVKASPTTVGTLRTEMEARGEVSKLDTRIDAKGIKQPARKKDGEARPRKPKPGQQIISAEARKEAYAAEEQQLDAARTTADVASSVATNNVAEVDPATTNTKIAVTEPAKSQNDAPTYAEIIKALHAIAARLEHFSAPNWEDARKRVNCLLNRLDSKSVPPPLRRAGHMDATASRH